MRIPPDPTDSLRVSESTDQAMAVELVYEPWARIVDPRRRPELLAAPPPLTFRDLFGNRLSRGGLTVTATALLVFVLLFSLQALNPASAGADRIAQGQFSLILMYLVLPALIGLGLTLVLAGALWRRRQLRRACGQTPAFRLDLSRARDRKALGIFLGVSTVFLVVTTVQSYYGYHYVESVKFCGQACHNVMQPEAVAHAKGAHARVACVECHVGPGAQGFLRAKLSGLQQVIALAADSYARPIPAPVHTMRPARETCEGCHWRGKASGNLDRTYRYFLAESNNPPHAVRLQLKVGSSNLEQGPASGIHWHTSAEHKIEYLAADSLRQNIPYIRMTGPQGAVTEFRAEGFTNQVTLAELRTMDCMDCHNRPAHRYAAPNDAVNQAMALDKIDASLLWIKTNAVGLLTRKYGSQAEALQTIATDLNRAYPDTPRLRQTIASVQKIYQENFFPEMRADWKSYPNHLGHKDWPGCFRCHDGKHQSPEGRQVVTMNCNACHLIVAQGSGAALEQVNPAGHQFAHPGGDYEGSLCGECHTGGL